MKWPTYKNKDVCIEYCRFSPSIVLVVFFVWIRAKNFLETTLAKIWYHNARYIQKVFNMLTLFIPSTHARKNLLETKS